MAQTVRAFEKRARRSEDLEFLPAALEVLETPLSPNRTIFNGCLVLLLLAALIWSCVGQIDVHAVAQGRIQPVGRSKVVQALEPGRVRATYVDEGRKVAAGEVLLELDPTETSADLTARERELDAVEAEIARRRAEIDAAVSQPFSYPKASFREGVESSLRAREEHVLAAELSQLVASRESLRAQLNEKIADVTRLRQAVEARGRLLDTLRQRVDMRETLLAREAGTRAAVIDSRELLERASTEQAIDSGWLLESEASVQSADKKLDELTKQFISDQASKLADAERRRDRLAPEIVKSRSKDDHTRIVAPIDGFVQQVAITSTGQIVTQGQVLMTIVPIKAAIEVEALVQNQDIGFVRVGQDAVVKIESFPFTQYGTISGKVISVSNDAVPDQEASSYSSPATAIASSQRSAALSPTPRTQNLVFPTTIQLDRSDLEIEGRRIPLAAGMAVTVEIKTSKRRVIDYVLSPLREITSESAHER